MAIGAEDDEVAVYQGTRELAFEYSLVLAAYGLRYQLRQAEDDWVLSVAADLADPASNELGRYREERALKRPAPAPFLPFAGAGLGALAYVGILLVVAYGADTEAFQVDWFERGEIDAASPVNQQWWRALTALTLHAGPEHLFGNLLFGAAAGGLCGRLLGPGVAWLSILIAAGLANGLELAIAPASHRAIGASTAVFAALGLLAGHAWRRRLSLRERWLYRTAPVIAGVSLLALLGSGTQQVDVLGHVLGFLAGLVGGWVYARCEMPSNRRVAVQVGSGASAVVLLVFAWWLALRSPPWCVVK
jgi:membrane associated rhomboid family serine protease